MEHNKIKVEATVEAPVDRVWECWNLPQHMVKWNFADPSWHCPRAENDLRVGGRLKSRMEARDGSFGFDFEAIYDQVVDGERIVYTMLDGRQASTTFEPRGSGTHISTVFDPEGQNPPEMQRQGWQAILDNFRRYVEG